MDNRSVEVSHEALIRAWPRLRAWIDENRAALRLHRQVTDAAEGWERLARDEGALFRGTRLAQALEWREKHDADLNALERAFLDASRELRDRETALTERRRRWLTIALASGMATALVVAIVIASLWQRSRTQERAALARATVAAADALRARALTTAPGWPDLLERSTLLAIEAHRMLPTSESAQSLRASVDLLGRSSRALAETGMPLLNADGTRLALITRDKRVHLVDPRSGQPIQGTDFGSGIKWAVFGGRPGTFAVIADGDSSETDSMEVWDLAEGRRLWAVRIPSVDPPHCGCAFGREDAVFAVADANRVLLLDGRTGEVRTRIEHQATVTTVAFSADGSRLASATRDLALITNSTSGDRIAAIAAENHGLALSADGKRLLSISGSKADVWDVASGTRIGGASAFGRNNEGILYGTFNAAGDSYGVIGEYGTGQLWRVDAQAAAWTFDRSEDESMGGANPRYLGFKSDNAVEIWDVTTGQPTARVIHADADDSIETFAFDAEKGTLVLAGEKHAWIHDTGTGSEVAMMAFPGDGWRAVTSPGGTRVPVSAGATLAVWDLEEAREAVRIQAAGTIADAAVSPDGRILVTTTEGNTAQVWDLTTRREVWRSEKIARASVNADGSLLATAGYDGVIRLRTLPGGQERWHHDGVPATVEEENTEGDDVTYPHVEMLVFSVDEKQVAARLRKKAPRVWEVGTGQEIVRASAIVLPDWVFPTSAGIMRAAKTPRGVSLWRSTAGSQPVVVEFGGEVSKLFFANGRLVTAGGYDAHVWDTSNGRLLGSIRDEAYVQTVAISPDGSRAATVTWGPVAAVYDVGVAQPRKRVVHDAGPNDQGNAVGDVAFSPDSKYLATASNDRTARVWDAETGREVTRLVHDAGVSLVAFSKDGDRITTLSDDQRVHVWLWRDVDLIARACERLSRNLTSEEWQAHFGNRSHAKTCARLP